MPPIYLWQSIVVTLLCCLPLGVIAIIFASQVESRYNIGDIEGSQTSSNRARNLCIWSLVAGLIGGILYFILIFVVEIGGAFLGI